MTKVPSIIFVTFLMITATYGEDATEPSKDDTSLDQPICILENYTDSNSSKDFKNFALYEECQLHLFMDVLEEIDCYIINKHSDTEYNCESEECMTAVFKMRDEIYSHRVNDYTCKCNKSRSDPEPESNKQYSFFSSLEYDYFTEELNEEKEKVVTADAPDKTIHTLCEYIDCWVKLWKGMLKVVKNKLEDILKENIVIQKCKEMGQKNQVRCKQYTTPPTCTEPTI